jgi:hypothetical protein
MRLLVDLSIHINYLEVFPERIYPGRRLLVDLSIHINYLEVFPERVFPGRRLLVDVSAVVQHLHLPSSRILRILDQLLDGEHKDKRGFKEGKPG